MNSARIGKAVAALVVVLGLGWGVYSVLSDDSGQGVSLVEANNADYRVQPEDAQGMDIPHQDKMVFNDPAGAKIVRIERIMPQPEQPVIASADQIEGQNSSGQPSEQGSALLAAEPIQAAGETAKAEMAKAVEEAKENAEPALGRAVDAPAVAAAKVEETPVAAAVKPSETGDAFDMAKGAPSVAKPVEAAKAAVVSAAKAVEPEVKKVEPSMAMEPIAKEGKHVSGELIQLASFNDRASAERAIKTFNKKYGSALQGVSLRVEAGSAKGRNVYRVRGNSDSAGSVCSSIKSMGGSCVVTR